MLLEIKDLYLSYGETTVLRGLSLDVDSSETVCIVGPSGGGKSSLLRCLNQLERFDDGVVLLDGERIGVRETKRGLEWLRPHEVMAQRRKFGMVFQQFNLFPHLSVLENVAIGLRTVKGLPGNVARAQAQEALALVGLEAKKDSWPNSLSGGQQQRVAIARAIAMKPKVMLFDEPTSALDPELVDEVLGVISKLSSTGMTMLIVSHEIRFVMDVADKVCFLEGGVVVESGSPGKMINAPEQERTAQFLRRVRHD